MADTIRFQEKCGCGAEMNIGASDTLIDKAYQALSLWRQEHQCPTRSGAHPHIPGTLGDWREKYVGQDCKQCGGPLKTPESLTTVSGLPVHLECRKCVLCKRKHPIKMTWTDHFPLPEGTKEGLCHAACARNLRDAAQAEQQPQEQTANVG
jgi:hypothetical protein